MNASGFDWTTFGAGFAVALLLVAFIRFRNATRASHDLIKPPRIPPKASDIPPELRAEIIALKAEGRFIDAIKLVRKHTGGALRESKDIVEAIN